MLKSVYSIVVGFVLSAFCAAAMAWPTKPITIVIPYAPGGGSSIHAMQLAADLEKTYNVQVIVKNIPGGNSTVAMASILNAPNDNHTFMWINDEFILGPLSRGERTFEKFKVTNVVGTYAGFLFGNSTSSVDKLKQQIARGQTVNVGTLGVNASWYIWLNAVDTSTLKVNPIPYKGGTQSATDLMGGQLEYLLNNMVSLIPHVEAGKVKPLMVTTEQRHPRYKDVPTFKEYGFSGEGVVVPVAFATRADTSQEAIEAFAAAVRDNTKNNPVVSKFFTEGPYFYLNYDLKDSEKFFAKEVQRLSKVKLVKE